MVDTVEELSVLSRKLNAKSDSLNKIIKTINDKLAKLNLGVETWLRNPIVESDPFYDYEKDETGSFPLRVETRLGYCKFESGWALAAKAVTVQLNTGEAEQIVETEEPEPLLGKTRNIRVKAMRLIPSLLDDVKDQAESVLRSIEEAEEAAAKL